MSVTRFTTNLRYALWRANDKRCFYCSEPINFAALEIDHLIPERTTDSELDELKQRLGLAACFALNSPLNLVPAHHICNNRKSGSLMEDSAIVFFTQQWSGKQQRIDLEIESRKAAAKRDQQLIGIARLIEEGSLSKQELWQFICNIEPVREAEPEDPFVVTFGVNITHLLESGVLPFPSAASIDEICTFLESELFNSIPAGPPILAQQTETSGRNGESLSIRIAFWNIDLDRLGEVELPFWEILEISTYSEIYASSPSDLLARAVVNAHGKVTEDASDPVFGIGRCPSCGSSELERQSATDYKRDETYYTIGCKECGWGDWTQ